MLGRSRRESVDRRRGTPTVEAGEGGDGLNSSMSSSCATASTCGAGSSYAILSSAEVADEDRDIRCLEALRESDEAKDRMEDDLDLDEIG